MVRTALCLITVLLTSGSACVGQQQRGTVVARGDPAAGRVALQSYDCGVCHVIPGVRGAHGQVGPPLTDFGRHVYLVGKFPNGPEMLEAWLRDPPSLVPETAMPNVGVTQAHARDMAAYLYTLR